MFFGEMIRYINIIYIAFCLYFFGVIMTLSGCYQTQKITPSERDLISGKVTLLWEEFPSAISYNVYQSTSPGVNRINGYKISNVTNPTIVDKLKPNETYYFVITAVNESGESIESKELSYDAVADKIGLVYWKTLFDKSKRDHIFKTAEIGQEIELSPNGNSIDSDKNTGKKEQIDEIPVHEKTLISSSDEDLQPSKTVVTEPAKIKQDSTKNLEANIAPTKTDSDRKSKRSEEMRLQAALKLVDSHFYIFFDRNSNDLSPRAIEKLDQIYKILSDNLNAKVTLNGYSDSSGAPSFSQMVSEVRAYSVKSYLTAKGIKPSRIEALGHGAQKILASDKSAEGRRLNRRVEIELILP
jgi:outer membrane protein OmpA-like peptidoglycan-associated protein